MKFSSLARPPIQPEEAERAQHSICPLHNGLVRETGDVDGKVMWCPIGRMYWRYSAKPVNGMYGPLSYRSQGVV